MAKMQEFKCPCCGGSIEFDSSVQKMKCPFCDTEFDVGTLSEYAQTVEEEQPEDMSWSDEAGSEWQDGESEGLRTYVCKSCGGEIVGDANTAATACPFCGSPVVMTGQLSGALKPDYVIPFKLDKKAAKERLKKHLTGKTNPDEIPCYRVVNAKGELSGAFAFGGADEQAKRLRADGIDVIDGRVDLDKYGIRVVDDVIHTKTTVEPFT